MSLPISIDKLISGRIVENQRIEYKEGWDPEPIIHSICGFANDFEGYSGGYIIIGVKANNGIPVLPIKGLDINKVDQIQGEIVEYCKKCITPSYIPNIEVIDYDDAKLIVLWVYQGYDKPYEALENVYVKGSKTKKCYIRKGSTTLIANNSEKNELLKSVELVPFDDRINRKATINDLKPSLIREFLSDIGSDLVNRFEQTGFVDICKSLHIVDGPEEYLRPKNVGLLLFNDRPDKFLPYSYIVVDYIPDPTGDGIITKTFYGPIYRQLKDCIQYIKNNYIEKLISKVKNQTESYTVYNYPNEVLDELLPNAILHKDYQVGEPITVRITNEYIEITSFPGIDFTISDEKIKNLNLISKKYRNKRIAEFLRDLELIEAKNTGIPKVKKALALNGSKQLEIDMDSNREYVSIKVYINEQFKKNNVKYNNILTLKEDNVLTLKESIVELLKHQSLTLTELSRLLGYSSIPNSLRRNLNILIQDEIIIKDNKKYKLNNSYYL